MTERSYSTVDFVTGRLLRAGQRAAARIDRADDLSLGVTPVREVTRTKNKFE